MIQGFYTAATSLVHRQKGIDILANNVANANTTGFKRSSANFSDALYSVHLKEYPDNVSTHFQVGSGSYIGSIERNMNQGALTQTGNFLDIALQGEGFMAVMDNNGEVYYTRGGSYSFQPVSGGKYISDSEGNLLLGTDGQRLFIPENIDEIKIDEKGAVFFHGQTFPMSVLTVNFRNPKGLYNEGRGLYSPTVISGQPERSDIMVRQGYIEMSNTDMAKEMTDLITYQRIYQMNARVLTTIDEMQSMANKLRK